MTTISVINVMPTTNEEVNIFVENAKEMILSGFEDPVKIAGQLKAMEEVIKQLRDDKEIKEYTLKEATKEGKSFVKYGSKYEVKEMGVKYDYSDCNYSVYSTLIAKMEKLKEDIKECEKSLKFHKDPWVDIITGEVVNPPVKTSTTTLSVTLINKNHGRSKNLHWKRS